MTAIVTIRRWRRGLLIFKPRKIEGPLKEWKDKRAQSKRRPSGKNGAEKFVAMRNKIELNFQARWQPYIKLYKHFLRNWVFL